MSFIVARFFYYLFWGPMKLLLGFFFRLETENQEDPTNFQGPLIIVSNHICWLDPFIIGVSFPFSAKVFPIRYACWWKYFYIPFFLPFVWAFGSFPIRKGLGLEKALRAPFKILKKGGVVGFFPRGQKEWKGIKKPKRGAAFLAIKTGTKLLPIKIEAPIKMKFLKVLLRQYKVRVKIGKPFSLAPQETEPPELLNQPANYLMDKVDQL